MSAANDRARFRGSVPWLGTGAAVSLLLHVSLGALLVTSAEARLNPLAPSLPNAARENAPRPRLGVERSTVASINWLGFEKPTDHAAPDQFELDQAALTRNPQTPVEAEPDPVSPPTAQPGQSTDKTVNPPIQETETKPEPVTEPTSVPPQAAAVDSDSPVVIHSPSEGDRVLERSTVLDSVLEDQPKPEAESDSKPERPATKPATGAPAEPLKKPSAPAPTDPAAIPDDRDSPAAAREISVSLDRLGKPAAGEGIEIHTVRIDSGDKALRFLAGSLSDPVVLIEFTRPAKGPAPVSTADYERVKRPDGSFKTNSTSNPDIDRILRLNIYRWTATGKAIDELEPGEKIQIRLSIDLN